VASPLNITRFDKMLRRLFVVVGRGAIVTTLLEDVFPTVDLFNPSPEFRALGGEHPCFGKVNRNSTTEFNAVQLFNPVGSGLIGIVEEIVVNTEDQAGGWHMTVTDVELGSEGPFKQFRDSRLLGSQPFSKPGLKLLSGNNPLVPQFDADWAILQDQNDTEFRFNQVDAGIAILSPGFGLVIENDNEGNMHNLRVNFLWRERAAEPSELSI